MADHPFRPTPEEVAAAEGRRLRDVIGPDLSVLFCGINPGLYSGAVGHHFARPGNRFWPALHQAGFTDRLLSPFEDRLLLEYGLGVTNLVNRATRDAGELSDEELSAGAKAVVRKVKRYRPLMVAFLGVTAYRQAFDLPAGRARIGPQSEPIRGMGARLWLLPNPSGRTAAYKPGEFVDLFKRLREDSMQNRT